jgi:hypothetical protein
VENAVLSKGSGVRLVGFRTTTTRACPGRLKIDRSNRLGGSFPRGWAGRRGRTLSVGLYLYEGFTRPSHISRWKSKPPFEIRADYMLRWIPTVSARRATTNTPTYEIRVHSRCHWTSPDGYKTALGSSAEFKGLSRLGGASPNSPESVRPGQAVTPDDPVSLCRQVPCSVDRRKCSVD